MSNQYDYDVTIIGGGPGGYVAGIRAAQLGLKVCIIEKEKVGGVCLNVGCIPSKVLIYQAELLRSITQIESLGIKCDLAGLDYGRAFEKSRKATEMLSKGVQFLLKKNKINVVKGEAKISSDKEIIVDGEKKISTNNIIVATGSSPKEIPGFVFDENTVLSSTGALMLDKLPKSILILGAGAIGIEFAHIMNAFGVDVSIAEMMDSILPACDTEIAGHLRKILEKRGIKIFTGVRAKDMEKREGSMHVCLETKEGAKNVCTVEKILVSAGRKPNSGEINLASINICCNAENAFIPVGDYYETSVKGVFAIGDVIDTPQLAHLASKEGEIVAEYIAGVASGKIPDQKKIDPNDVPNVVYAEPQIAGFGHTLESATEKGLSCAKSVFPYVGCGKAVALGKAEGMVKIIFDPDNKNILGAHILGADASEMIHEILVAKKAGMTVEELADVIHAHPTFSEVLMEAAKAADRKAIHI